MAFLNEINKKVITKIAVSIFLGMTIFASLSLVLSLPLYIIVPILSSFFITCFLREKRFSAMVAIPITVIGGVIFSNPLVNLFYNSIDRDIYYLIFYRQREMLVFSPPLLPGILGGILGWGLAQILLETSGGIKYFSYILLVLMGINFIAVSMDLNPAVFDRAVNVPIPGQFNNLNSLNLKTFYYMKNGSGFYEAYNRSYREKADTWQKSPETVAQWRQPTLFYLWKLLLPGDGFYILYLYLLMGLVSLFFIFDISRSYLGMPFSLLPPLAVSYLFIYGAVAFWFTFPEYWGVFFTIFALWGIHKENRIITAMGMTFSVLSRSIFMLLWMGLLLVEFLAKKTGEKKIEKEYDKYLLWIPGGVYTLMTIFHLNKIITLYDARWITLGEFFQRGLSQFLSTLYFGSVVLSLGIFYVSVHLAMAVMVAIKYRNREWVKILTLWTFIPLSVFMIMGDTLSKGYWGIVYLPFLFILSLFSLSGILNREESKEEKGK